MTYEAVFILDSRKVEDGGEAFARDMSSHVKALGGTVTERTSLGRKSFARPIGKHRAGTYWVFLMELAPSKVSTFHDKYRLNNLVLRVKTFKVDPKAVGQISAAERAERVERLKRSEPPMGHRE